MAPSYKLPKLKRHSSTGKAKQAVNKRGGILLLLEYHIFLQALIQEVSLEARNKRSKVIRQEHVRAVGKRALKKFKP